MTDETIRIDDLPTTLEPSDQHVIPAMHNGLTVQLTVRQILNILKSELLGTAAPEGDTLGELLDLINNQDSGFFVGSEMPWHNATPPAGWFIQDGSTFDAIVYPLLNTHLGGNILPDVRAEFIRGNDNGRGIDIGRVLGSLQGHEVESHQHEDSISSNNVPSNSPITSFPFGQGQTAATSGNLYEPAAGNTAEGSEIHGLTSATGGPETRPRNISKNWIIKHD
jgi:microcystin-dependent protein